MLKKYHFLKYIIFLILFSPQGNVFGQCTAATPSFTVNLTGNPNATWVSTSVIRDGSCCPAPNNDNNCVRFVLTLDPGTERIRFNIASGAVPSGSLFWQLGCTGLNSVGQAICISGTGPHVITFCKPGNNENTYSITAIGRPTISPPTYVSQGCTGNLSVLGYDQPTITWRSINPGAPGAFNSYLNCATACSTVVVTAQPGYPPFVDYEVSGVPAGGCTSIRDTQTVRVTFVDDKAVTIVPANPTICFGGINTSATAMPTGGLAPYTYSWSNGATTQTISVGVGTYTVIVGDQTTCPTVTASVTVTANPSPITANAGPDVTTCANNPVATLNGSVVQATGGTWSGGAGAFGNVNSLITTYSPSAGEITSGGPVRLILTTTGNGSCPAVRDTMFVSIAPSPIVNAGGNQSRCANNPATTLNGTVTNATGGTWSGGAGTYFPNADALNAIYTPTAAEITAGNVTLTLTSTGNASCNAVSSQMTINFTAAPTVDAGIDRTVCANNQNVLLAGSVTVATGGTWSGGGGSYNPDANTLNATYTPSAAEITAGTATLTLTTTGFGICNAVSDQMTISITPAPTANAGIDRTVCGNNASVVLTGAVTVATGGTWSGGTGTFNPDENTLNATYTPSAAEVTAGTVTLTLTTTGNGLCNAVIDQMLITITATPTANANIDRTVCGNNPNVVLAGSVTVATGGTWSGGTGTYNPNANTLNATYTPSGAEILAGTATLTLTTTGNGTCNAVSDQMDIIITPAPTINAGPDQSRCANNAVVTLTGTRTVATASLWTTAGSGGFANDNNLNTTYTPSAADITAGTVTLTLTTTAQGTCNPVADQIVITLTPAPIVNAGADQVVCANNPNFVLNGSITVATGGTWSGGTGIFNPDANTLTATYTPSAAEITAGTVTLTLTSTGNGTCIAVTDQMTVSITPAPTVNAGLDRTVCANNQNVVLAGSVTVATGATWSGGAGIFSPNINTLNATYTPSGAEVTAGTVTLTLTTTGNGTCNAVMDQMIITINPAPTVNAGPDQTVCANNQVVTLAGSRTVATGATWSGGGGVFNPNNTTLTATYTPNAAEIAAGTVNLTLTTTGNGLCNAVSDFMVININPAPTVNAGLDRTVCANNQNVTLAGAITVATGATWSGGTGIFNPDANTLNAVYTPSAAEITAGTVTLTLTTTGNGLCNAVSDQMVIFITPAPTADANVNQTVCANNPSVTLNGSVTIATGGTWSGGTGTLSPNANTLGASYTPSAAEITAGSATLTLTTTGNGLCNAVTDQMIITITPAPTVNANIDQTVCANNPNVTLAGIITVAASGIWSGGAGSFNPDNTTLTATYTPTAAEITAGTVNLTLTTTGNGLCNAVSDQMAITITIAPTVNAGPDQTVCGNNPGLTLAGSVTIATGGTWSGGGAFSPNANTLNAGYTPSSAEITAGSVTLTLTTTGNGNCNAVTDQVTIIITPSPTVNAGPDQVKCANNSTVTLAGSVTVASGGVWSDGGGTFVPNANTLNATYIPSAAEIASPLIALVLTTTGNGTCIAVRDTVLIIISPSPVANANIDQSRCFNNPVAALSGTASNFGAVNWSTGGTGTFAPNTTNLAPNPLTYTPSAADLAAGSVTLTLTATRPTCNPASDQMVITYTPSPTVNAGPDQTVCANNSATTLSGAITVATGATWSGGAGTFAPNANTLNAVYTPSPGERTAGTVTLTLTTTGNGNCLAVTDQVTITITPAPTVNANVNQAVCANNSSVTLNGSVTIASGGVWSGGAGIFSPNANTLNATYNPTAAEITAGTVSLTLTTTGNGNCLAVSDQMIITITPAPTINAGPDQAICSNNATATLNGSVTVSTGGIWVGGNGIYSPDNTTLNATYTPTPTEIIAGTVSMTLASTGNGNCNTVTDDITITISPSPTVSAGPDQGACASTPSIPLNGTITVATGGTWTTGGTGTFSPNANTLNASYVPSAADLTAGSVTLTLTTTGNGNCLAVTDNMTITFTVAPTVNAGADQTVCTNDLPIQLNGSGSPSNWVGGAGTFNPNRSALNATYTPSAGEIAAQTVNLTLTTIPSGSCGSISDNVTFTIPPGPVVSAGPDQTVCGDIAGVVLNGTVSNAGGGIWTTGGTGTFSPNATTLNASYIPSAAERAGAVVTLTLTSTGNGFCSAVLDQVVITITTGPTVNAGLDQTVCADVAGVSLNGAVTIATGGTWSGGGGTFAPNANTLNATYTPSPAERVPGTITLTLLTTGNGTCTPVSDQIVITITPAPTVDAGADQTICGDAASTTLNGSITVASGAIWTTTGNGTFSPNDVTLNASYFPTAADTAAGTVTFTLTTTGNGTCNAVSDQMVLTITDAPTVTAGPDVTLCADANSTLLDGAAITTATGGSWTTGGTGTFSPDALTVNAVYNLSAADKTGGLVVLTLLTTGNGTCNAYSDQMVITITAAPTANAGLDQTICADAAGANLNGAVTVATGGIWTSNGTGSFSPNATTLNAAYIPSAGDLAASPITLTLTTTGNGTCNAVADVMVLTITPAPTVNANVDQTVCADIAGVALNGSITIATGGVWSGGTGTFAPNANTLNATYVPSAADISAGSVTLTLTTTGNGTCNPVTDNMIITITPAPTVNAGADQVVCGNNTTLTLNGAVTTATGGTWSGGAGVFAPNANTLNATYTPSAAEITAGAVTLTLTTTGNGTCNAVTDNMTITITPAPTVNAGIDRSVCANNSILTLNGSVTVATGADWSGGTGIFNPNLNTLNATYTPSAAEVTAGTVTLTLTTTGNGTCTPVTDDMVITITPSPTVNANVDQTVCANNSTLTLDGIVTIATGGTWSGGAGTFAPTSSTLNATYTPSAAEIAAGTVTLILTTTGNGTCNAETSDMTVTITPAPTANAGADRSVCANNLDVILAGSVTIATGGDWTGGTGIFNPDASTLNATYTPSAAEVTAGSVSLTLTTTGNGTCTPVTDQMIIFITPPPVVNAGADRIVCANNSSLILNGSISVATGATWTGGTGTFAPDANTLNAAYTPSAAEITAGTVNLTLTTTGNGTCLAVSDQMTITITPAPTVDANIPQTICGDAAGVTLNGIVTVASGGDWSTGGTGSFSPNTSTLGATYIPSPGDRTTGTVTLTLTSSGNGTCNAVSDQMVITITPVPTVDAGPDVTVCADLGSIILDGAVTVATGGTWTTPGTGIFAPDVNTLNATYNISAADTAVRTVTFTLTTTGNGTCNAYSDQMVLTITPQPIVTAGPDQAICADQNFVNLNGGVVNAGGGTWTTPGTGTFAPDANTLNGNYLPSPADAAAGTVTLTLTTTGNGTCNTYTDQMIINIAPAPVVNAGTDKTVCADVNSIALTGASVVNASGGDWTTNGTGTFTPNATTVGGSYNPSALDKATGTVILTLTSSGNGTCNAVSDQLTITITPAPTVNAGIDQTVCGDVGTVNLSGAITVATGATWSTATGTGTFSPDANTLNAVFTPSAAQITAGVAILTLTTTGNGTCNAVFDQMRINILPIPVVNAGPNRTVCADLVAIPITGTVTNATGGAWSTNGTGAFSPDNTTLNMNYIPSAADKIAGTLTLTLVSTGNGTCNAVTDDMVLRITPAPTVDAGPANICANSPSVQLNGTVTVASGGTWTRSGTGTFAPSANILNPSYSPSAADVGAGFVMLYLTTTGNGTCIAVRDSIQLDIVPPPSANAGPDEVVCANNPGIVLNGTIIGAMGGTWTSTGGGAFSPDANTLNATYTVSGLDISNGSATLTLTTTGIGNCNPHSDDITFIITPAPTANAGTDQTVCGDTLGITLDGSVTVATGGTWTTGGSGMFSPDANTLNATYIPSPADTAAGNVTLTLTTTGNGLCIPVTDDVSITITPAPVADAGPDQIVCGDIAGVGLTGNVTVGTGGLWSATGAGSFDPSTSTLNAIYFFTGADISSGTVNIILTSTGNGMCKAARDTSIITITPAPTVTASAASSCSDQPSIQLNGAITIATGATWSGGAGIFTPDANTLNPTYEPSAGEITTGSVMLYLTTTGNGDCNAVQDSFLLNIIPAPTSDAGPDQTVCGDIAGVTLAGAINNAGGGLWTTSGSGTFVPDATTLNATYDPSDADTTAGTVTLVLTTTGNGICNAYSDTMVITITDAPTVDAGPAIICSQNPSLVLNGVITTSTGGIWSTTGDGIFTPTNTDLNATYTLGPIDLITPSITLTLLTTGNGMCNAISDDIILNIAASPSANANVDQSVCANNGATVLDGSVTNATGGVWSTLGSGTFSPDATTLNATYNPSNADTTAGTVTLVLTTTGNGVCSAVTDTMVVTITDAPAVDAGPGSFCSNNPIVNISGTFSGVATSAVWTTAGTGGFADANSLNTTYTPSPGDVGAGSVKLYLTTNMQANCSPVQDSVTINITPAPNADANVDQTVCADVPGIALDGIIVGALGGGWTTSGSGTVSPDTSTLNATYVPSNADTTAGSVTLTLTTTGNGPCNAVSDQMIITITPAPTVNAGIDRIVCADISPGVVLNGIITVATGATWSSTGSGGFSPNNTTLNATYVPSLTDLTTNPITLTLTTNGSGTCNEVSDSMTITITPAPTVNAGPDTICSNAAGVPVSGTRTIATGSVWSSSGTGSFAPNATSLNTTYIISAADRVAGFVKLYLTTTGNGTCNPVIDSIYLNIVAPPTASAGADQNICAAAGTVNLNGAVTTSAGGIWTTMGTGTFSPDNITLNGIYNLSQADTAAHQVTLVLTTTGNQGCIPARDSVTIFMTPAPVAIVNAGADVTICADVTAVPLNGVIANAAGGEWTTSGSGVFSPSINTLNADYLPDAIDAAAGSVMLILTSTGNGICTPIKDTMMLTITPVPTVNADIDQTVCADVAGVSLNGSIITATGATWTTSGTGTFTPDANTLSATYVPSSGDIIDGSAVLTLTTTTGNGTCNAVFDNMNLTITPAPTANAGADQIVCADNGSIPLNGVVTVATGGTWTTTGGGSFTPDANTLNASYIPDPADNVVTLTLTTTTGNGTCIPVSDQMTLTRTTAPTVNANIDQTVCADTAFVSLNGNVTISSGAIWTSSGTGTFSPSAITLNANYTPSAADRTAGSVRLILTSTGNGNCNAVRDTMFITITPAPTVDAGPDQVVCADIAGAVLNGIITVSSGGDWTTSGSGSFTPDNTTLNASYVPGPGDITSGSATLTLTTTGNGSCKTIRDNVLITITPAPTVNAGFDQTVCANNSNVTLNGSITTATGATWSGGAGTFTPDANTLNATYTPSAGEITAGTVTLTLTTTGNGTCNPVSDPMTITITPAPTVDANIDQTVCADVTGVTLDGIITVASGGLWSSSGTGTFVPNGTLLDASYVPSSADTSSGNVILVLTSTGNGSCLAVTDTMNLIITPAPIVNAGPDQVVCGNNVDVTLSGSMTVATGGTWSGGGGAFNPDANTLNTIYTPSPAEIAAGIVTLTLTSTVGNGTCNPVSDQITITITTTPTANAGPDQSACANNATLTLNGAVTVATGGDWSGGTGTFNPSANTLSTTYTLSAAEIALGTVTLTLSTTGNGTCLPATDNMTVTVTPAPTADANSNQAVCANNPDVTLDGIVTIATGGVWSGGAGIFAPDANTLNAVYTPTAGEIAAGAVTLTLTTTGSGSCIEVSDQVLITITPAPTVNAGTDQTVCANNVGVNLLGIVTVATGGTWTGGTGTYNPDANTLSTIYTPSAAEIAAGALTLTLTTTGSGSCIEVTDQIAINITPAPVVNAGPDATICANNANFTLNGSVTIATGGTWSGGTGTFSPTASTLNATYTPSAAEITAGTVTLTLTSTGNGTCTPVTDQIVITITPAPTASIANPNPHPVCADVNSITLNGSVTNATGGEWSTSGSGSFAPNENTLITSYVPSPGDKAFGTIGLTLTTTGVGNCLPVSRDMILRITPAPTVNAGVDRSMCADAASIGLVGTRTVATASVWTTSGSGIFTPNDLTLTPTYTPSQADSAAGVVNITLTTTAQGTCNPVSHNMILTITPIPTVNAGPDQTVCADVFGASLNGAVTIASGGRWTTSGSGSFSPNPNALNALYIPSNADTTAGSVTLTLTTTGNGFCNAYTDNMVVTITPKPIVIASSGSICADFSGATLDGRVLNASGGAWTTSGSGTFAPNAFTLNAHYTPSVADMNAGVAILTLTSTGMGTCNPVSDDMTMIITPLPVANAGTDQIICRGTSTMLLAEAFPDLTYAWFTTAGANIGNSPLVSVVANTDSIFVLTVTDTKGCSTNDTVRVAVVDPPVFAMASQFCLNGNGTPININSLPDQIPLGTFQWIRNDTLLLGENNTTHSTTSAGQHVIQYNAGSCSAYDTTTVLPAPFLDGPDLLFCIGVANTVRTTTVPGATYQWTNAAATGVPIGTNADSLNVTIFTDQTFIVTVTGTNTCSNNDTILVETIPLPTFDLDDVQACIGDVVTLSGTPNNVTGAAPSYVWSKGRALLPDTTSSIQVSIPDRYSLIYTTGQCRAYDTTDVVFNILPATNAVDTVKFCKELDISASLDAGTGTRYVWIASGDTLRHEDVYDGGLYYVRVYNQFNCFTVDSVYAKDICPPRFHVPTAFLPGDPNHPGDNYFQVFGMYLGNFKMTIFNRWGEIIFHSEDKDHMWDGTYRGELMPVGVYPYVIVYEGEFEEFKGPFEHVGSVTVVR